MVETALTLPMLLFAMLGIVQLSTMHHARILSEYAAFKAARAGSVYRAECKYIHKAAAIALVPSIMEPADGMKGQRPVFRANPNLTTVFMKTASYAMANRSLKGTPILWAEYKLDGDTSREFDKQLESDETPLRLRVRLAYFYEMRIPFANWVMTRYWLATQLGLSWGQVDGRDSTMLVKKANRPMANLSVDWKLVDEVRRAMLAKDYVTPIVATWSMRMMSDPSDNGRQNAGKSWACN